MHPIYFFLLAIIGSIIHILIFKTSIAQTTLLYLLLVTVGFQGLFAFTCHFFRSDETAKNIGWPIGNPFQLEIAFTNLAFGVLGILCIWLHGYFWLATIIGKSIFLWGATYVHFMDIKKSKNFNLYNTGPVLYADILSPVILIALGLICFLTLG